MRDDTNPVVAVVVLVLGTTRISRRVDFRADAVITFFHLPSPLKFSAAIIYVLLRSIPTMERKRKHPPMRRYFATPEGTS